MLEAKGIPAMAERTLIRPPSSHLGPIADATRAALIGMSPLAGKYDTLIDRESAFEILQARASEAAREAAEAEQAMTADAPEPAREFTSARRYSGTRVTSAPAKPAAARSRSSSSSRSDSVGEAFAKSFARQLGTQSGRAIVRGVLGGLFRSR